MGLGEDHAREIKLAIALKDKKAIKNEIETLESWRSLVQTIGRAKWIPKAPSARKVTIPFFVAAVILSLAILTLGFAGMFVCVDRYSEQKVEPERLFSELQRGSSYGDYAFFSFTIISTTQQFSIRNTSALGRWFVIAEFVSAVLLLTLAISLFFASMQPRDDIPLYRLPELTSAAIKTIDDRRQELKTEAP